ncbi:conserved hypothetical protein [Paraburkholderia ribeironis]|uniref:DUF2474 domain-containing protein n=1 Tax=Paraburkholderia ribeironis TaxID=1247936 RepID=A0A1N7SE43_9BURK|nr:hypothetical protein [Paraburkholderia ribeironis]SIT45249.1 conserved hypothetical protein [Paraburkholderia ribeironis]
MTTSITITEPGGASAARNAPPAPGRKLPGWLWFIVLWCVGVGSAMSLGFAFKLLMNATLFAIK